jgi:benzoyl-CoA reductase/2-hydroxyglutaryl-CoA dehydratase subunit BcrC/BadD/HgdB
MTDRLAVRVLGADAPVELLTAAGLAPVPLVPDLSLPTPRADAMLGAVAMGPRGRSLVEQVLADPDRAPVLITHADEEQPQIYAALRELMRTGEMAPRPVHFLDLVHQPRESSRRYNRIRIDQCRAWVEELAGRPIETEALSAALATEAADPFALLAEPGFRAPSLFTPAAVLAARTVAELLARGATRVVREAALDGDAAAWDAAALRKACAEAGLALEEQTAPPPTPDAPPPRPRAAGERSRNQLASVADFGAYQRDWFADIRQRVAKGAPFAVVNANAPQEILRAMDVPFVVNQWWAAIVAAKQQSGRYADLLRAHGFPADAEAYSSQGLAAAFDTDAALAPWGGLPKPDFLHAVLSTDATGKIFSAWADVVGADLFLYERTVDSRAEIPVDWWNVLPERWDEGLEPERLDLLVAELETVVARLSERTGRTLDRDRLREVMHLVNEQEDYYRNTRDLIAAAAKAPVGIADTMPATMVPQWHRGTPWARDAAKAFYEEVAGRVERGEAACADERIRLMWVGRGMWSEMGFYQRWEESHGAVFVWSMYLALAADGYIRTFDRGRDPMRALAARFVTMGDELRMPTWAGAWHVHEAGTHRIDGAVALADADPFTLRALEKAGVPVLQLDLDNYAKEEGDADDVDRRITAFIEMLATR